MADVDYSGLTPTKTIGGEDQKKDDRFLLSQSQHILMNGDHLIASMLLNYIPR